MILTSELVFRGLNDIDNDNYMTKITVGRNL